MGGLRPCCSFDRLTERALSAAAVAEGLDDDAGRVRSDDEVARLLDERFGALGKSH